MAQFDPYHTWLAIQPKEHPLTHYRLLGIRIFEGDVGVIENAAERQVTAVQISATQEYAEESQKILNEIAAAKVCLMDPRKKKKYDKTLQSKINQSTYKLAPPTGKNEDSEILPPPKRGKLKKSGRTGSQKRKTSFPSVTPKDIPPTRRGKKSPANKKVTNARYSKRLVTPIIIGMVCFFFVAFLSVAFYITDNNIKKTPLSKKTLSRLQADESTSAGSPEDQHEYIKPKPEEKSAQTIILPVPVAPELSIANKRTTIFSSAIGASNKLFPRLFTDTINSRVASPKVAVSSQLSQDGQKSEIAKKSSIKFVHLSEAKLIGRTSQENSQSIRSLIKEIQSSNNAEENISILEQYLSLDDLEIGDEDQLKQELEFYKKVRDENLVRIGKKWVQLEDAQIIYKESRSLMHRALGIIEQNGPIDKALSLLSQASRKNPDLKTAHYITGLIQALWLNDAKKASIAFRRLGNSYRDYPAIRNNLALCDLKQGNYESALSNWMVAIRTSQGTIFNAPVVNNIRRFARKVDQREIKLNAAGINRLKSITDELDLLKESSRFTPERGWEFARWLVPNEDSISVNSISPVPTSRVLSKLGTGIALGNGYVLTSLSSISVGNVSTCHDINISVNPHTDSSFTKTFPTQATNSAKAQIIAICNNYGLVLLRCPQVRGKTLPIASSAKLRGGDQVHVFHQHSIKNLNLSSSNLSQTSLFISDDSAKNKRLFFIDKKKLFTSFPMAGSPVIGDANQLVGMIVSSNNINNGKPDRDHFFSVTSDTIIDFLKSVSVTLPSPLKGSLKNPDVSYMSSRVVTLQLYYAENYLSLNQAKPSKFNNKHFLCDHSCFVCNGRGHIRCSNRKCVGGNILNKKPVVVSRDPNGNTSSQIRIFKTRCPTCRGKNNLICPACRGTGVE